MVAENRRRWRNMNGCDSGHSEFLHAGVLLPANRGQQFTNDHVFLLTSTHSYRTKERRLSDSKRSQWPRCCPVRKLRTLRSNKCINLINYGLAPRAIKEQVLKSFLKEYCTRLRKNKERFVGMKDKERLVGTNQ